MSTLTLFALAIFVLKLSLWCLLPYGALRPRRRSAAERHLLLVAALVGTVALPLAEAWLPQFGPGWLPEPTADARTTSGTRTIEPEAEESSRVESRGAVSRPRARSAATAPSSDRRLQPATTPSPARPIAETATAVPAVIPVVARLSALPLGPAVALLWLLGVGLSLGRLTARFLRLRGVLERARRIRSASAVASLERAAAEIGTDPPALFASREVSVPIAVDPTPATASASDRRAIVLPVDWSSWTPEALRVALLHELAHLKRGDGWATLGSSLVVALYWWHPAVRTLASWARREAERAADDLVLAHGEAPSSYADQLLLFARKLSQPPLLGVSLMNNRPSELKQRVVAILDPERQRTPLNRRLLAGGAGLTLLLLAPLAGLQLISASEAAVGMEPLDGLGVFPTTEIQIAPPAPETAQQADAPTERAQTPIQVAQNVSSEKSWKHGKTKKKETDTDYSRAYDHYREGRFDDAVEAFVAAADAGDRVATSLYNAACSAALAGNAESALAYLERSIDAGWDDPQHVVEDSDLDSLRADARFQAIVDDLFTANGEIRSPIEGYRLRSIEERYEYLTDSNSRDGKAWYKNGTDLLSLRQFARAETALDRAVELLGHRADSALYNLACLHALAGSPDAANETLKRAIEAGYGNVAHMRKDTDLRSLRDTGGFAEAIALAETLDLDRFRDWDHDGDHDGDHHGKKRREWSEYDRGRWSEAVDFYRLWTAEHPEVGRGWYNLGWALHHSRRFGEAIVPFERAAEAGYSPYNAAYNIACGHAMQGSIDEAFRWLDVAIDRGYTNAEHLERDRDLANLHSDPRFRQLIWSLEEVSREACGLQRPNAGAWLSPP